MSMRKNWLWLVIFSILFLNSFHETLAQSQKKRGRLFAPPSPQEPANKATEKPSPSEANPTPKPAKSSDKSDYPSHGLRDQEEEFAESNFPANKNKKGFENSDLESDSPSSPKKIVMGGGIGIGAQYFGANLRLLYYTKPWFAWDLQYAYHQVQSEDWSRKEHEPSFGLRLSYPNSTMLTPYIGAGPGMIFWDSRWKNNSSLAENKNSPTFNYLYGISIALNRFISIDVSHRFTNYLSDPPKKLSDPSKLESKNQSQISVGFTIQSSLNI